MAKSYVTKFVEYVDICKQNLKSNLAEKDCYVDDNDTLDTLVNKVGSMQPPPAPDAIPSTYVRDSNLPDLDAMFDADPLRYANGGQYYSCAYAVGLYANYSTSYDVSLSLNYTSGKTTKIVFEKSGREIDATTTTVTFKLNEDDLYTLTDGTKVFVIKIYSDIGENSSIFYSGGSWFPIEVIEDNSIAIYGYNTKYLRYYKAFARASANGFNNFGYAYPNATVIINGNILLTSTTYISKEFIINGDYTGTSSSITFTGSQNTPVKRFIVPAVSQNAQYYGSIELVLSVTYYSQGSEIYIPNSYSSIITNTTTSNVPLPIETLHIPNSISVVNANYGWFVGKNSPVFDCLFNVTMSDNAFALPTSTFALYFDKMPNLTIASLTNIVNALADRTGKTAGTVRFTKVHQKKLTEEQIASLQSRNWTVSFV